MLNVTVKLKSDQDRIGRVVQVDGDLLTVKFGKDIEIIAHKDFFLIAE